MPATGMLVNLFFNIPSIHDDSSAVKRAFNITKGRPTLIANVFLKEDMREKRHVKVAPHLLILGDL